MDVFLLNWTLMQMHLAPSCKQQWSTPPRDSISPVITHQIITTAIPLPWIQSWGYSFFLRMTGWWWLRWETVFLSLLCNYLKKEQHKNVPYPFWCVCKTAYTAKQSSLKFPLCGNNCCVSASWKSYNDWLHKYISTRVLHHPGFHTCNSFLFLPPLVLPLAPILFPRLLLCEYTHWDTHAAPSTTCRSQITKPFAMPSEMPLRKAVWEVVLLAAFADLFTPLYGL